MHSDLNGFDPRAAPGSYIRSLGLVGILFALFASCSVTSALAQGGGRRIALVDRIVAVVNNEVITRVELQGQVDRSLDELRRRKVPLPAAEDIERQALERLIMDRVQIQFANQTSLKVDDLELDRALARIAESNNLSLTEFRRTLERDGVPFDRFREEIRQEIVLTRLREREVDNKITVGDSEIDNYLLEQRDAKVAPSEFHLAHILVRIPEQASPEQVDRQRTRAEEAGARLKQGADFAQVAATYSDAPDGLKGGDMGWRSQDRLPELFAEAAAKLNPGDVSAPLRSPAGFHILKLVNRRGGTAALMIEQTHVRHILARTNEVVSEGDAKRKLVQLRERIVNGAADFADLARQHSDDGSASRGGDLGWLYPGDTVPEFERSFRELKPMEISEPIKSSFGWHLMQVIERRVADVSSDRKRLDARRVLRDRKSDEAYQDWLRQMRDRAYVEYRLEDR